jgi:hypothetical protein
MTRSARVEPVSEPGSQQVFVLAQRSPLTRTTRRLNTQNLLLAEFALGELEAVPRGRRSQDVHLDAIKGDG